MNIQRVVFILVATIATSGAAMASIPFHTYVHLEAGTPALIVQKLEEGMIQLARCKGDTKPVLSNVKITIKQRGEVSFDPTRPPGGTSLNSTVILDRYPTGFVEAELDCR